jgi:hypothetical protein
MGKMKNRKEREKERQGKKCKQKDIMWKNK